MLTLHPSAGNAAEALAMDRAAEGMQAQGAVQMLAELLRLLGLIRCCHPLPMARQLCMCTSWACRLQAAIAAVRPRACTPHSCVTAPRQPA